MASGGWRELSAVAASQHGAFTRAQAAACGIGWRVLASQLSNGLFVERRPGVLVPAAMPPTFEQELTVAQLASKGAGVASHRAAARLHALDGFEASDVVELTVPRGRLPRLPGVVLHRTVVLEPNDVVVICGVTTTCLTRTLADLGAVVDDDALEAAVDAALRAGQREASLRRALARLSRPGPSGTGALGRVLDRPDRVGRLPDSRFERFVDRLVRFGGIPSPERQHEVRDGAGRLIARLDLAWPDARLGVEAHSDRWHYGPRRGRYDQRRDNALADAGWEVLYVGWHDATRDSGFDALVSRVYRRRLTAFSAAGPLRT